MPPTDPSSLVMPIRKGAPPLPSTWPGFGEPSARWCYRDRDGFPLFAVLRFDPPGRPKIIRPATLHQMADGTLTWQFQAAPAPRAIFNLHLLAKHPDAPVLVVEGEKAAEAASDLFPNWVVTTSGSSTSARGADWSPLAGRRVAIWPDADEPGRRYAADVCLAARAAGAEPVGIVELPNDLPNKWDLADLMAAPVPGLDASAALARIEKASRARGHVGEPPALPLGTTSSKSGPWIIGDIAKMLGEPPPPIRWLVPGLIPGGMPGIFAARAGAGKSMTSLSIALGLASGLGVLGRPVSDAEARGVLFVGLEDDADEFHRRLSRGVELLREDPGWTKEREGSLHRRLRPLFPNRASGEALYLETQWSNLAEMANAIPGGCGLIILDTLARMTDGDENKASDVRAFNESVSALVQGTGATVLSIHHVGKGNDATSDKKLWERLHPEALRGSSAVEAAARFVIQLAALSPAEANAAGLDPDRALRGGYVAMHLSKISSAEKGDTILLERRQSHEPGAGFLTPHPESEQALAIIQGVSAVIKLNNRDKVLLAIAEAGGLSGIDQDEQAAIIWPDAKDARNQWNKCLSALRKSDFLRDPKLTDKGLAKAQTLSGVDSFHSVPLGKRNGMNHTVQVGPLGSGQNLEGAQTPLAGPEMLEIPVGIGEVESTESRLDATEGVL